MSSCQILFTIVSSILLVIQHYTDWHIQTALYLCLYPVKTSPSVEIGYA